VSETLWRAFGASSSLCDVCLWVIWQQQHSLLSGRLCGLPRRLEVKLSPAALRAMLALSRTAWQKWVGSECLLTESVVHLAA
jgi:hypothetical protein